MLRNWRFCDRLGVTVARWLSGLGWHVCVRRNVSLCGHRQPLTPSSPIVLTFYIALPSPGADPALQGVLGRARLLATSYGQFEREIIGQMDEMFSSGRISFQPRRRWRRP